MRPTTVWTLLGKIALVCAPFFLLFIFILIRTPYITQEQQSLIQDKMQKLIVDAPQAPQVIIAGDSRAEDNVIPDIFQRDTGLRDVNVGAGDEQLNQVYDTLQRNGLLNHNRLIVISVSIYDINDAQGHNQSLDKPIIDAEPLGIRKLKDYARYYKAHADYYIDYFKAVMRFAKLDHEHMDPGLLQTKGYTANDSGILTTPRNGQQPSADPLGWYSDLRLGGIRQQDFVRAVQRLGTTNDTIVLYVGPVAPLGKVAETGTAGVSADKEFAKVINDAIAPYSNIHFINFAEQNTTDILPNETFVDYIHLNPSGAETFTGLLVNALRKQSLLPPL